MNDFSRRAALTAIASGSAIALTGCAAQAQTPKAAPATPPTNPPVRAALAAAHTVKPLPFDPSKLAGLSERMLVSHHDNNYAGAVKSLSRVEEELLRVTKETPPFVVGGLKQSELTFRNSATLHELYFGNLGGDGKRPGPLEKAFGEAHGTFAHWEEVFRATGATLGGGSGWVITGWDFHRETLATFWSGNHTQALAGTMPLLVMDMYEHAYQIDYGAAAAKYIDAFMQNIKWEEVHGRLERARKASATMHA